MCAPLASSQPICGIIVPVTKSDPENQELTENQSAWVLQSEALWREAHAIAAENPGVDATDVYHALRSLALPPAERLRRGLTRVRTRPHDG